MNMAATKNIGALLDLAGPVAAHAIAAGLGDNIETDGADVDRLPKGLDVAERFDSAVVAAFVRATLAATETATVTITIQDAPEDATTPDTAGTYADVAAALQPTALVLTGGGGGTTETGVIDHNIRLSGLRRFVRIQVLIDLSAGVTDIGSYGAGWVLGGPQVMPV